MDKMKKLTKYFGGQAKLAGILGLSQGAISHWLTGRAKISPRDALKIEKMTKGKFTAKELRPDIFDLDTDSRG